MPFDVSKGDLKIIFEHDKPPFKVKKNVFDDGIQALPPVPKAGENKAPFLAYPRKNLLQVIDDSMVYLISFKALDEPNRQPRRGSEFG